MRVDLGMAGLPRLEIEVDFHPRLLVAVRGGDFDDYCRVAVSLGPAIGAPQELEEILARFGWYLDPHRSLLRVVDFVCFVHFQVVPAATACLAATLTSSAS